MTQTGKSPAFTYFCLKNILLLKQNRFKPFSKPHPGGTPQPHLAIFDKIGIDWTPPIAPRSPLQIIQIRLVSLWRTDDDGGLGDGTVPSSDGWQVERVAFVLWQEFVALIALHGVERWSDLRRGARGARLRVCQIPEVKVYTHLGRFQNERQLLSECCNYLSFYNI